MSADRAVRFLREHAFAVAARFEELPYGVALLRPDLPLVYALNFVWVDDASVGADRLLRDADRILGGAGLGHRRVFVPDARGGGRLRDALVGAGYEASEEVLMIWRRAVGPAAHETDVEEVSPRDACAFTAEMMRRGREPGSSLEACEQVGRLKLVLAEHGARFFGVRRNGEVVSACDLYLADGLGQIEDLQTMEEHRRQGLARAVTLRAAHEARAAGCELVFLAAEANDWPKELYERLGFEPVASTWSFERVPGREPLSNVSAAELMQ